MTSSQTYNQFPRADSSEKEERGRKLVKPYSVTLAFPTPPLKELLTGNIISSDKTVSREVERNSSPVDAFNACQY